MRRFEGGGGGAGFELAAVAWGGCDSATMGDGIGVSIG